MALEISFVGGEARQHHIEANEGLESLAGLAHAGTLVAHYVATRVIRQRQPYDDRLRLFFQDARPGSLTAVLAVGGALAMGAGGNLFYDLLKEVWKRATGTGGEGDLAIGDQIIRSGDVDALSEAVSPSLLRGHAWIGGHDKNISIKTGRQILVDFNDGSKRYLKDEVIEEGRSMQDVTVAALNVNSRHGRVFFFDLGRTIPFKVDREAASRTMANLALYLREYARRNDRRVNIMFRKVMYIDGRLKRIIIYDCADVADAA